MSTQSTSVVTPDWTASRAASRTKLWTAAGVSRPRWGSVQPANQPNRSRSVQPPRITACQRCVWVSTNPGMTSLPEASTTRAPGGRWRAVPTAAMAPPRIRTSAFSTAPRGPLPMAGSMVRTRDAPRSRTVPPAGAGRPGRASGAAGRAVTPRRSGAVAARPRPVRRSRRLGAAGGVADAGEGGVGVERMTCYLPGAQNGRPARATL